MAERLLVVEDEVKLAGLLRDYLAQEGYAVSMLHRGDQVEEWVDEHGADLVVTSWDVLTGDVTPKGDVLFFDDNGTHSALSAAELIARDLGRPEPLAQALPSEKAISLRSPISRAASRPPRRTLIFPW